MASLTWFSPLGIAMAYPPVFATGDEGSFIANMPDTWTVPVRSVEDPAIDIHGRRTCSEVLYKGVSEELIRDVVFHSGDFGTGQTIASIAAPVVTGSVTLADYAKSGQEVQLTITGGTVNTLSEIDLLVTTTTGQVLAARVRVRVEDL